MSSVDNFYIWYTDYTNENNVQDDIKVGKRKRKKTNNKQYFTIVTEKAIIAYNKETNLLKRDKIFEEHIYYPLDKLVENIYNTFKFSYFNMPYEDIKAEVVSFLVEKLDKFTEGKGKAFSYFSIVAKNYLIIHNNKNYERLTSKCDTTEVDESRDIGLEVSISEKQDELTDFINLWTEWYDENLNCLYSNKRDIVIADGVLELFRVRQHIENFNKKALYILIRERTGYETHHITKIINKVKQDFSKMYLHYKQTTEITLPQ